MQLDSFWYFCLVGVHEAHSNPLWGKYVRVSVLVYEIMMENALVLVDRRDVAESDAPQTTNRDPGMIQLNKDCV